MEVYSKWIISNLIFANNKEATFNMQILCFPYVATMTYSQMMNQRSKQRYNKFLVWQIFMPHATQTDKGNRPNFSQRQVSNLMYSL